MRWILYALGLLVLLAVGVWLVGSSLPVAHTATASAVVPAAPAETWRVVTDVEGYPSWRPGVETVEAPEAPMEEGAEWVEQNSTGRMTFRVVEWEPPRRWSARIVGEGLPFGGAWIYELEPEGGATRVTITEEGEIYNPFFRFVSRFVVGYDGTMRSYLEALGDRLSGGVAGASAGGRARP